MNRGALPATLRRMAPIVILVVVATCGGPVAANPPAVHPLVTPVPTATPGPPDPRPVLLPADDAPHDRLTEWWYYTGHLRDDTGGSWGFEFVVFRAERGGFPVSWASHLALTDERGGTFHYAQRAEIGPQVDLGQAAGDTGGRQSGFDLAIRGVDPLVPSTTVREPWVMSGADGSDELEAAAATDEVTGDPASGFGLALTLAATRPPTLHDGDGYIDFGPAGGSYYVSRTAMDARGTISVGDRTLSVGGTAWFDHQWGDFIAVGAGGWDWFAINLADGTDIMLSLVRATDGTYPLVYGTYVPTTGATEFLDSVRLLGAGHGFLDQPSHGDALPGGLVNLDPDPSAPDRPVTDRGPTGAGHAGDDGRRLLGGIAACHREPGGAAAGR